MLEEAHHWGWTSPHLSFSLLTLVSKDVRCVPLASASSHHPGNLSCFPGRSDLGTASPNKLPSIHCLGPGALPQPQKTNQFTLHVTEKAILSYRRPTSSKLSCLGRRGRTRVPGDPWCLSIALALARTGRKPAVHSQRLSHRGC